MLDIVIVNWNAGDQLHDCISSIHEHGSDAVKRIIVVDNGSTDGSADAVADLGGVKVIRAGENLGFAAGCNRGARQASSPYLLFLNPDTRIEANSLPVPLAFMEDSQNAHVGICGIQLVDEKGNVSRSCAYFPTMSRFAIHAIGLDKLPGMNGAAVHMKDWDHAKTRTVDHVMGAFYLIRRSLFEQLGGFDERFFVYTEDVDLSFRAHKAGYASIYLADAQAFHAGGGTSQQVKAHRLFYSIRSRLKYGFKHFPIWQAWLLTGVTYLLEPISRTAWCLLRRDVAGVRQTWSAYWMLLRDMMGRKGHVRDLAAQNSKV